MAPPLAGEFARQPDSVESRLTDVVRCGEVVTTASGLSALECSLVAQGMTSGSLVACDALYPFAAMAILAIGARPVPFDICPDSMSPDPEEIGRVKAAGAEGAVLTSYFGRRAACPDVVAELSNAGLAVVEDRAQCFGEHSDPWPATFSFQDGKFLSCGFGGAVAVPVGMDADRVRREARLGWWPRTPDPDGEWTSGWQIRVPGRSSRLAPAAAEVLYARLDAVERDAADLDRALVLLRGFVAKTLGGAGEVPAASGVRLVAVQVTSPHAAVELREALHSRGVTSGRPAHPPVTQWPGFASSWHGSSTALAHTRELLRTTVLVDLDSINEDVSR